MFRSLLDHRQVHKELKYAMCNKLFWYAMGCTLQISALCGPDDGRVTTEICCPNEFT